MTKTVDVNFLSLLTLLTAILGFTASGKLLLSPKHHHFANLFLGMGFFGLSYRTLTIYLLQAQIIPDTFAMGSVSFVYYWILPSIFLYCRVVIKDQQSLSRKDYLHYLPGLMAVILIIYYLITSLAKKGYLSLPHQSVDWNHQNEQGVWQFPAIYHALILSGLGFVYASLCWQLVYVNFLKKSSLHPQAKKIRNWICFLLVPFTVLLSLLFFGQILSFFFDFEIPQHIFQARSFLLLFLFIIILTKRDLLFGLPDIRTALPAINTAKEGLLFAPFGSHEEKQSTADQPPTSLEKFAGQVYYDKIGWVHLDIINNQLPDSATAPPIEKDKAVAYINRINTYLKQNPYTDPDFGLPQMTKDLSVPLHHLEYLFRYYNKYSFSEFRNLLRVQYTLKSMEDRLWKDYTLEAIGQKAGFSSRTTFFRVFKQVTGKSPKSYLDAMETQSALPTQPDKSVA